MTSRRQAATMAAACFRPRSPATVSGVAAWGAYLAWLGIGIESLGTTAYIHLFFAVATLGAWLGACVRHVRGWPNAVLVPGYRSATGVVAAGVAVAGFGCCAVVAWFGGLGLWPLATVGVLALTGAAVGGLLVPGSAVYLLICMHIVAILARGWGPDVVDIGRVAPVGGWATVAVPCALALLWAFATLRVGSGVRWSVARHAWDPFSRFGILRARGLWEPSLVRVAAVFGGFAVVAAVVQRVFETDLRDESWLVLIGTLCANTGATGASVAFPRGPLGGASWLLLLGAAGRGGVGRRVQWRILGDSLAAAVVFAAASAALGADFRLVEMLLLGFACSSVYAAVAGRFRWLMSSRLSGLVATPVVVAMVLAAWWEFGSWGLPATAAAWIAGGGVAVLAGGRGIGRLDLDFGLTRER